MTDFDAIVRNILKTRFAEGTCVQDFRRDPDDDAYFVTLDDPTNEFEFVEIWVHASGTWEQ